MGISDLKKKKKKRNENDLRILHIQINVGSKFQLQQLILIFSKKIDIKKILSVEKRKMNITIDFFKYQISKRTFSV